jgi:hypothetical protein
MAKKNGASRGTKNPVAVALARLRSKKLTPKRRSEIARGAAQARWGSTDPLTATKPVDDVSVLIGGLPDGRSAEVVLEDLHAARRPRPFPA